MTVLVIVKCFFSQFQYYAEFRMKKHLALQSISFLSPLSLSLSLSLSSSLSSSMNTLSVGGQDTAADIRGSETAAPDSAREDRHLQTGRPVGGYIHALRRIR